VLAGGTGSRLFPLTKNHQQTSVAYLRPADDLLSHPDAGGCRNPDILIVTGGRNSGDFPAASANGKQFGLEHINYTYQEARAASRRSGAGETFRRWPEDLRDSGDNIIEGQPSEGG